MDTIRIFIGTEPKTHLAQKVLEFSIQRRTKAQVAFTPMIGPEWEYPIKGITVGTGFSLRRWMIPSACGWDGHAIYMDADQLVFGDVQQLWDQQDHGDDKTSVYCTYQPDKFSAKPWPQTSVMLINCRAAALQSGHWFVHQILDRLRLHTDKKFYADLMHGTWLDPQPRKLPVEWNHLNVFNKGRTKLLHYTKEPEQPWYKPDHALSALWENELRAALAAGYVTRDEIQAALDRWNVQEDWRKTNGLHPHYRRLLAQPKQQLKVTNDHLDRQVKTDQPFVLGKRVKPKHTNILWVTSFGSDMYEASGKSLLKSFLAHDVIGKFFVGVEGINPPPKFHELPGARAEQFVSHDVSADPWLKEWLEKNADVIPEHLGGTNSGKCECPGGPFEVHDKRHTMPCIGHWFNRNASRWFRKIVTQRRAIEYAQGQDISHVIWLDSDCVFRRRVTARNAVDWFKRQAFFYLKSRRPIMEAGVLGFDLIQDGQQILDAVVQCYDSGNFRKHARWDDSAVYQKFVDRATIKTIDIALGVGKHAAVVPHSPLHLYLAHDKGRHGRKLNIMK